MSIRNKFQMLTFINDFIFGKVMRNKKLCKKLLEVILGIKIRKIKYLDTQKAMDSSPEVKSIRLDVYVEDDCETIYNIEMQTTDPRNLPKRMRYYHSMIDMNMLKKGNDYNKLNKSYVIFICTTDIFGKNKPVYLFENYCKESGISLGDEAYTIILNAASTELKDSELDRFLRFVQTGEVQDDFTRCLATEVDCVKQNQEWQNEYLASQNRDNENINKGMMKGIKMYQKLLQIIPKKTEDYRRLNKEPFEDIKELEKLAAKYGVEE